MTHREAMWHRRRNCGTGILPVKKSCATNILPVKKSCGTGILPVEKNCGTGILPVEKKCGTGILPVKKSCGTGILPVEKSCGTGILPVEKKCGTNILPVEKNCGTNILPVEKKCGTNILPVEKKCGTNILPVKKSCGTGILPVEKKCGTGILPVRSLRHTLPALSMLTVSILLVAGCRPKVSAPTPATKAPPIDSAVVRDSPQEAVSSLMAMLCAQLEATGRGDLAAAGGYRDQVAWHIVARPDIVSRYRALGLRRPLNEVEMVAKLVDNWTSIIAYYADGLELDRMETTLAADGASAVVRLPVAGPKDRAVLMIACSLDEQEDWRVLLMEFAPPPTADSQPAATTTVTN